MDYQRRFIAVDIGGTLAKLCYIRILGHDQNLLQAPHLETLKRLVTINNNEVIQFQHFKSNEIQQCIDYINKYLNDYDQIALTGGGSFKYKELFDVMQKCIQATKKKTTQVNEFDSLLKGVECIRKLNFSDQLISVIENKVLYHEFDASQFYPFLMVNVGSGVSILKLSLVDDIVKSERIGGTCLGGGFFLGLSQMLVGNHSFMELLEMASEGDNKKVDIVSGDYPDLEKSMPQLMEAPVLISLGKMNASEHNENHVVNSLFKMVAYNLAQLALMYSNIQNVDRLVFTGFFCRNNTFMIDCFGQAFRFFSKQQQYSTKKHAYGFKHDGYIGSLGALWSLMDSHSK